MIVCLTVPPLVAFGRLYRGMHHLTDIAAAFLNGITCVFLAYWWYRAGERSSAPGNVRGTAVSQAGEDRDR